MSDLTFTGERFVPGQGGYQIAYEHMHRYLFASRWAKGGLVLDIATGLGYGASLLASQAAAVCAVDLDGPTLAEARNNCKAPNIHLLQADATRLPLKAASCDLVVAMEVLEHLADPESMVREMARVAQPGGMVIISTPNRASYSDARKYTNPYHVHEFYQDELLGLLEKHFGHVDLLEQQVRAGSYIQRSDASPGRECEIITEPPPDLMRPTKQPLYFLALCRVQDGDHVSPSPSAYVDLTDGHLDEWNQRLALANSEIARVNAVVEELGSWAKVQDQELSRRDAIIRHLQEEVEERQKIIGLLQEEIAVRDGQIMDRDRALAELRAEFDSRGRWALSLEEDVAERDKRLKEAIELLDRTDTELKGIEAHLARIRHAFLYRVLCRLSLLPR